MKKIVVVLIGLNVLCLSKSLLSNADKCDPYLTTAFTAGYVFKHDDQTFKQVYGRGMGNVLTADVCYYPWKSWGIGAKVSYWVAVGHTTFFRRHSLLQEIPVTVYLRRTHDFCSGLQLYASLGGGFVGIVEQSYLGTSKHCKGIGEVEGGLNYPISCSLNFTSAFRYLFPRQKQGFAKVDVGGFDLRAGIGLSF